MLKKKTKENLSPGEVMKNKAMWVQVCFNRIPSESL